MMFISSTFASVAIVARSIGAIIHERTRRWARRSSRFPEPTRGGPPDPAALPRPENLAANEQLEAKISGKAIRAAGR